MAERNYGTEVEGFVLDLDAILRIGGVAGVIDDDANTTIEAALAGAESMKNEALMCDVFKNLIYVTQSTKKTKTKK
jgi:hypothetical protein